MEKKFAGIITLFVGALIAVIMVTGVVLPTVFAPTNPTPGAYTNTTAIRGLINNTGLQNNFTTMVLTNVDTSLAGTGYITYQLHGAGDTINVSTSTGTFLATISGASPKTFSIPAASMTTNLKLNYTANSTGTGTNITQTGVSYSVLAQSTQQSWGAGTIALWAIVAIAVVAMLLLFLFGGGR